MSRLLTILSESEENFLHIFSIEENGNTFIILLKSVSFMVINTKKSLKCRYYLW